LSLLPLLPSQVLAVMIKNKFMVSPIVIERVLNRTKSVEVMTKCCDYLALAGSIPAIDTYWNDMFECCNSHPTEWHQNHCSAKVIVLQMFSLAGFLQLLAWFRVKHQHL
jgi:hypothetical protein